MSFVFEQFDLDTKSNPEAGFKENRQLVTDLDRLRLRNLVREKMLREREATNLYEPLPNQLSCHQSQAKERLLRGSNRAGKTLAASAEVALVVANRHPWIKYPKHGRIIAVGRSEEHIGNVMWDKLTRMQPNFRRIKDLETGKWRNFHPWDPSDMARKDESVPQTPLIPQRLIDGEPAWYSKKEAIPRSVRFKTGWEIKFFTGGGSPPQGMDIDFCLAGWSELYDPVRQEYRRIDEINEPFHVWSYNEESGEIEIQQATRPFIKGCGEIVEVRLSNGQAIHTTRKHRVLTTDGHWVSVQEACDLGLSLAHVVQSPSASIQDQQSIESNQRSPRSPESWTSCKAPQETLLKCDGDETFCSCSGQCPVPESLFHAPQGYAESTEQKSHVLRQFSPSHFCRTAIESHPLTFPQNYVVQRANFGLSEGGEAKPRGSGGDTATKMGRRSICQQSLELKTMCHTNPEASRHSFPTSVSVGTPHAYAVLCVPQGKSVLDSRGHCSPGSHQCDGRVPFSSNDDQDASPSPVGAQAHDRFSMRPDGPVRREQRTHTQSRFDKRVLGQASPFQSPVFVESITSFGDNHLIWDIGVPETHNYVNGDIINHNCWFDEELERDEMWYNEMSARLLDRGGRFLWSATAQAGGDVLWRLHQRAMEEEGSANPSVTEHPILLSDNPHIGEEEKEELKQKFAHDPDAYRVRILGEYLITSFHIYPTFSVTNHCCEPFDIPDNWCRYMIVDPGTVVAAVLFVAVPPDNSHVYCYDEMYLRDSDPQKWIETIKHKTDNQIFQSFIIDDNGSRRTDASSGSTVRQVYADLLKSRNIKSRETGHSFRLGDSNVKAGLDQVRRWLVPKENSKDGKPFLQIFLGGAVGCHHLVEEFQRYHKKRNKTTGVLTDEPVQKHNHQMDNLRYAAMHGCHYVEPKAIKNKSRGRKMMDAKKKRKKQQRQLNESSVVLG